MRKRIEAFSKGDFRQTDPVIQLSQSQLEIHMAKNQIYHDDFQMMSQNGDEIRGIAYSSSPRLMIENPEFSGKSVSIRYQYDSKDLLEGDIQKGFIYLLCNGSEYTLSFVTIVEKNYPLVENRKIRTMDDFLLVARQMNQEAVRIFQSGQLTEMDQLTSKEKSYEVLLRNGRNPELELEEYLIAIGRKERTQISLMSDNQLEFYQDVTQQEMIKLNKKGWGYVSISIECDSTYISFDKRRYTVDDFIGSNLSIPIYICNDQLHFGKNQTYISITNGPQTFQIQVLIHNKTCILERQEEKKSRNLNCQLMKMYLDYRLHKVSSMTWANESLVLMEELQALDPNSLLYILLKAQILLIMNRKQDAELLLNSFRRQATDRNSEEWGYYLYLTTFLNRDKIYLKVTGKKVGEIYKRNLESILLFWTLLYLDEDIEYNKNRRMAQIIEKIKDGCASPIVLIEGWKLLNQDPLLLTKINDEYLRILLWGIRRDKIEPDLEQRILEVGKESGCHVMRYHVFLCAIYDKHESTLCVEEICRNLLRSGIQTPKYHIWFQKGVELKIHLTNLYEAYLLSLTDENHEEIPTEVLLYFQYKTTLPYRVKALIYAKIMVNRGENVSLYLHCKSYIEEFALQQLADGHIDENLVILYQSILKNGSWNHELARVASYTIFLQKIEITDMTVTMIHVKETMLEEKQSYPVLKGVAYIPYYGNGQTLIFEKKDGGLFYTDEFNRIPLLNGSKYLKEVLPLASEQLPYLMSYFYMRNEWQPLNQQDLIYLNILLARDEISGSWKQKMESEILHYYETTKTEELLDDYLNHLKVNEVLVSDRLAAIDLMVYRKMYDKSYALQAMYECDEIDGKQLLLLCQDQILKQDGEIDDTLLSLCTVALEKGQSCETLMIYLQNESCRSSKILADIWRESQKYNIDTTSSEERLLSQMLYTSEFVSFHDQIFEQYVNHQGKKVLIQAYLSFFANQYLIRDTAPLNLIVKYWRTNCLQKNEMPDCCSYALLKWFSSGKIRPEDEELAKFLYHKMIIEECCFAFYKKLPDSITKEYPLNDTMIVEYHGEMNQCYTIHYEISSNLEEKEEVYQEVGMIQTYPGIFTFEVILFFGEVFQYYITLDVGDQSQATVFSGQYKKTEILMNECQNGYDKINHSLYEMFVTSKQEPVARSQEEICRKELL